MGPVLIRHYVPQSWVEELQADLFRAKRPVEVRLTATQVRHPDLPAWAVSVVAGFIDADGRLIELVWYCGAATGENAAHVEQLKQERLDWIAARVTQQSLERPRPGRFMFNGDTLVA